MGRIDAVFELVVSLGVDLLGLVSYFTPVGELLDVATAPINMYWVYRMLSDHPSELEQKVLTSFAGVEELAPFIDAVPSATIAWVVKHTDRTILNK